MPIVLEMKLVLLKKATDFPLLAQAALYVDSSALGINTHIQKDGEMVDAFQLLWDNYRSFKCCPQSHPSNFQNDSKFIYLKLSFCLLNMHSKHGSPAVN